MTEICEKKFKNFTLKGISRAGTGTSFILPEIKLAFDLAQGLSFTYNMNIFLITHGHMDHAGGIPYVVSQRALMGLTPAPIYVPETLVKPMVNILDIWKKIENFDYEYDIRPALVGEEYKINDFYSFKPFKTVHRVPSQGYTIYTRKKKLLPEFRDLKPEQIKQIKQTGTKVDHLIQKPMFSFTGDTQIEFMDYAPDALKSEVLLMECTYFDESRPVERARKWGHTHLDEIIERIDEISSPNILLTHSSSKYTFKALNKILNNRLSASQRSKVWLFPDLNSFQ